MSGPLPREISPFCASAHTMQKNILKVDPKELEKLPNPKIAIFPFTHPMKSNPSSFARGSFGTMQEAKPKPHESSDNDVEDDDGGKLEVEASPKPVLNWSREFSVFKIYVERRATNDTLDVTIGAIFVVSPLCQIEYSLTYINIDHMLEGFSAIGKVFRSDATRQSIQTMSHSISGARRALGSVVDFFIGRH